MVVDAPPRPPSQEHRVRDEPEALIEEARRRTRRRRLRYVSAALTVVAVVVAGFAFTEGGGSHSPRAAEDPAPSAPASQVAHANGVLAIVDQSPLDRNTLAVVNPDGSGFRRLTECPGGPDCSFVWYEWSPDGKQLAFLAGNMGGAVSSSNLFLYVITADGTGLRRLARCGDCGWHGGPLLSWSPESRQIVLAADDGLRVVDVDIGAQRRLTRAGGKPAWSPDGSRIAYAWSNQLFTIKPDGSVQKRVAVAGPEIDDAAWSPDGTRIAFDAVDKIYVVDADGSHLRLLVSGPPGGGPGTPSWSPDGSRIVFFDTPHSHRGYTASVWVMRPDGTDRRRLYHSGCCVGQWSPPVWSPDGNAVAVGGDETNNILVVDTRGHHQHTLAGRGPALAWQPLPAHAKRR